MTNTSIGKQKTNIFYFNVYWLGGYNTIIFKIWAIYTTIQILELKCTKGIFQPIILCSNIFNTIYTVLLYTFILFKVHTQYVEQYPLIIINIKKLLPCTQTKTLTRCPSVPCRLCTCLPAVNKHSLKRHAQKERCIAILSPFPFTPKDAH